MTDTEFQATPWAIAAREFWERAYLATQPEPVSLSPTDRRAFYADMALTEWRSRFPQPIADIDKVPPTLTGSTPSANGQ